MAAESALPYAVQRKEDDEEDFVFVNGANGDKEPVVFLLGWLGAQDRHLAKYCTIYNQRGCITIRYTSPSAYLFIRPATKLMPIARKLLSLLHDMSLDDHPVFFHMFSNNGSVLYYYLTQAMAEPNAPRVRAVYAVTQGSVWLKLCMSLGMMLYLLGWKVLSISWIIISGKLPIYPPWTLVEDSSRCPQLFLYSRADKLIGFQDVELFISERQRVGVPIVAKCWPDSQHVQHYRIYPEEYREEVYSFLTQCLSQEAITRQPLSAAAAATTAQAQAKNKSD
ncbi:Transmembrane protein 53-B [Chionoecetes opilio]|uniref:Transmembrane protein 53-B n=1 Tax=Chionoecetes opilio TaxID=41210 RepID=A0A8J4YT62_CHIOP|nr:Transmembrane protein 53-B [Chionoecetes opilio]